MQELEHPPPGMAGGHQGRQRPQAAAALLVGAHAQKDVVEKIEPVGARLEQAKPLG